jgi:hypothetical protein
MAASNLVASRDRFGRGRALESGQFALGRSNGLGPPFPRLLVERRRGRGTRRNPSRPLPHRAWRRGRTPLSRGTRWPGDAGGQLRVQPCSLRRWWQHCRRWSSSSSRGPVTRLSPGPETGRCGSDRRSWWLDRYLPAASGRSARHPPGRRTLKPRHLDHRGHDVMPVGIVADLSAATQVNGVNRPRAARFTQDPRQRPFDGRDSCADVSWAEIGWCSGKWIRGSPCRPRSCRSRWTFLCGQDSTAGSG